MQTIHFFAGANTAQGFYSCFQNILPPERQKRMYYIKGGPGVGKSTLMKRVGMTAEEMGLRVERFHCSSDPDSLDGVAIPERGIGMMDGTAPHVYDPVVPGARDTLLSLGDFLDEPALRPHARDIAGVQKDISARFARCYRYLAAAKEVLNAAPLGRMDEGKASALAEEWAQSLPLRGGKGRIRKLFASAFTPKGMVTATDFGRMERCIRVDCPFGADATAVMRGVAQRAARRGLDVVELLDPLQPERVAHVMIPEHGVAFCTGNRQPGEAGEWVEAETLFTDLAPMEKEQSFDRNAFELLCQRAVEQLSAAKALHDELEAYYVKHMDFLKWNGALERVLETLE